MEKISNKGIEDIHALTFSQEGMLNYCLKNPQGDVFFEQVSIEIFGKIDWQIFRKAWKYIVKTNETLRSAFRWEKIEHPIQIVIKDHDPNLLYFDISELENHLKKRRLEEIKNQDRLERFDLHYVPFRITLCDLGKFKYELIISHHHILYDGWSSGIIIKEFFNAYNILNRNNTLVTAPKTKFKEFVKWSQNQNFENQELFWKQYLGGIDTPAVTSAKRRKEKTLTGSGVYKFKIDRELNTQIKFFLKDNKITLASLFYCSWGWLLHHYNSCNDVLFEATVSGRPAQIKNVEEMVGLFINTLPIRMQFFPDEKIADFLVRNYKLLQQWSKYETNSPLTIREYLDEYFVAYLFDSLFVIENYPLEQILMKRSKDSSLTVTSFSYVGNHTHDLSVLVTIFKDISIQFTYNEELFDILLIEKIAEHFLYILRYFVRKSEKKISALSISSEDVRKKLLDSYSDVSSQTSAGYTVPRDWVEETLAAIWVDLFRIKKKEIDINTSFFTYGGHSLKATMLAARVHRSFNIKVPLMQIFQNQTIRELAGFIKSSVIKNKGYDIIRSVEKREYYPLSPSQKRLYMLLQMDSDSTAYNGPMIFMLEGSIDQDRIGQAFEVLIYRHESLRTSFLQVKGEPVQRVSQNVEFELDRADYSFSILKESKVKDINTPVIDFECKEEKIEEIVESFIKPFILAEAPLIRVKLIKMTESQHFLLVDMHHLITDGTSTAILTKELGTYYNKGKFSPLRIQYKDFSHWKNEQFKGNEFQDREQYWLNKLAGELPVLNITTDFPRSGRQSFDGDRIHFVLSGHLKEHLAILQKKSGTTFYMLLLTAYTLLLGRYSGQEDIIVGTPIAGRNHEGLENSVGFFLETLLMRNYPSMGKTIGEFITEVKETTLNAYENQDYPFRELVKKIWEGDVLSRNPLFDAMLNVLNQDRIPLEMAGVKVIPYSYTPKVAKVDITLDAYEERDRVFMELEFCTALFRRETMERFSNHLINTLTFMVNHPTHDISDIELMDIQEKQQILDEFNASAIEIQRDKLFIEMFETQVNKTPYRIALAGNDDQLSYSQLNNKSNGLAWQLRKKGVKPDTIVGLMVEPSPFLILGIIGILKSSGAYLPLDSAYPIERIHFMLQDTGVSFLFAEKKYSQRITFYGDIIEPDKVIREKNGHTNLSLLNNRNHLVYVIYTSGSTGRPKGVCVLHKNLTAYLYAFSLEFSVEARDIVMQQASYSFDAFVEEVFPALTVGARLVLPSRDEVKEVTLLSRFIARHQVSIIDCSPLLLSQLNRQTLSESASSIKSIHTFISGGDVLKGEYVDSLLSGGRIYNTYGPTETTICATYCKYFSNRKIMLNWNTVPIGKPIANYRIYILDDCQRLQPVGVPGEISITGVGVTGGYLNRPQLTHEKFVRVPWQPKEVMYKTGDVGKWHPDGNIEFLGRKDRQVNFRGFRVELGEVENLLSQYRAINEVSIVPVGDSAICAYFTAEDEKNVRELRHFLSKKLPDYMIPAYFIQLEQMPLTTSGKINVNAFPPPGKTKINTGIEFAAPESKTEKQIVKIWEEVLGLESIGVEDNFFELGGDSIAANQAIAQMRELLAADISLRAFFEVPYIRRMAQQIERQHHRTISIPRASREGEIPLSFPQERLWFLQNLDAENVSYFVPRVIRITGQLKVSLLEQTFSEIIRRHEILRTQFPTIKGRPVQRIQPPYDFKIPTIDWSILEEFQKEQQITTWIKEEGRRPFDFEKGPMLRATLLKLNKSEHLLVLTEHHLVHDGWTQGVLLKEFITIFTAYSAGKKHQLPELPIQYADYAIWQRKTIKGKVLSRHLDFWKSQLSGMPPVLELPTDRLRPPVISGKGAMEEIHLSREISQALLDFSRGHEVTLFMTMLSTFYIFLYRYTGVEDLCVGTGIANRRYKELEGMLGMVINTLALRTSISGDMAFSQCLQRVKDTCLQAYEHEDTPFDKVVEILQPERNLKYTPVIQVMFSFMDTPTVELSLPGLRLQLEQSHNRSSKFDINIVVVPPMEDSGEDRIFIEWEYNTDIFEDHTVQRMLNHYVKLLKEIVVDTITKVADLTMLGESEIEQLLYRFNETHRDYPEDKTVLHHFLEQVLYMPDRIVSIGNGINLTYGEFNRKVRQLVRLLQAKGVHTGTIAAVIVESSLEMMIGIMGILGARGAYLPISPDLPEERLTFMLKDSSCSVVLAHKGIEKRIKTEVEILELEQDVSIQNDRDMLDLLDLYPTDSAYVIYTSGSTGNPKGVLIQHRSLNNLCHWHNERYGVTFRDRATKFAGIGFDASVWEIFPYLIAGAAIDIVPEEIKTDIYRLNEYFEAHDITITFLPTQLCEQFMELNNRSLRLLLTGGDKLSTFIKRSYQLVNNYGPTENTVVTTSYLVEKASHNIPIGKPISNTQIYILSIHDQLQPIGAPGELCVAGAGVAVGYLNRLELTAEKFRPRTYTDGTRTNFYKKFFQEGPERAAPRRGEPIKNLNAALAVGDKIYRTGDWARWLVDGNIEFLGRIDLQVKIRGFRIELEEIEKQLLQHGKMKASVVLDKETVANEKYLCAYIVGNETPEEIPTASQLKEYLSLTLPDYMIPSYFVILEKIPLTSSGKVDRKALPEPEIATGEIPYTPPRNQSDKRLVDIWTDILSINPERIGIDDNFFQLGGHSLRATLLTTRIHQAFNIKIPVAEIFKRPVIRKLSDYIKNLTVNKYSSIEPAESKEYYPLSSAQKRLYILQQMETGRIVYNIPSALLVEGKIDVERMEQVFQALIARHESLRASFVMIQGEPMQRILDEVKFKIGEIAATGKKVGYKSSRKDTAEDFKNLIEKFVFPFDLSHPPLLRVGLMKINEKKYLLIMDMHHIVSDGLSMKIFIKEFMVLYMEESLPELRLQYKDFSQWQQQVKVRGGLLEQEKYWKYQFKDEIPLLEIPTDYVRPEIQSHQGSSIDFEIESIETENLKIMALHEGVTLYILLLTLYNFFLSKICCREDIVVGTPVAGRSHGDLQGIIGIFINTLALRNFPSGAKSFKAFLKEVAENLFEATENQDFPFEDLVDVLEVNREANRNPLFDTMFVLQEASLPKMENLGLSLKPIEFDRSTVKFDLTLRGWDKGDKLEFNFEYDTALFKESTIRRFVGYFKKIVFAVLDKLSCKLWEIEIIPEQEKNEIIYRFNNTKADYPKDKTLHELLEIQVERTPDSIALAAVDMESKEKIISFSELSRKSDQLANLLRSKGIESGEVAAVMSHPAIEMIVTIMGILKAGGCYLPIDPLNPPERTAYLLKDSEANLLLTPKCLVEEVEFSGEILDIEDIKFNWKAAEPPEKTVGPGDNLYMIYTSGTTGTPKGVLLKHENLVNYVNWFSIQANLTAGDKTVLTSSFAFDLGYTAIYPSLLQGGQLHLIPRKTYMLAESLLEYINSRKISYVKMTPSLFSILVAHPGFSGEKCPNLRLAVLGGEAINTADIEKAYRLCNRLEIMNHYGPTEVTIGSIARMIDRNQFESYKARPTIGKPIFNTYVFILDRYLQVLPVGIAGEICLCGAGVAKGYHKRETLTAEKFIYNTLLDEKGTAPPYERVYRTGDLGLWLSNGEIEFLGRIDHQVKIRGYRIELGEIENRLIKHPEIKESVVMVWDNESSDKYIVAYIVPYSPVISTSTSSFPEASMNSNRLKVYLSQSLPDYMIPSYFILLEKIPLTPNGKIDRKSLPEPETGIIAKSYVPPRDWVEMQLESIWSEVLGMAKKKIGIDTNFFSCGGHSLKATRMVAKVSSLFKLNIPLIEVFKSPTIRGLSLYIRESSPRVINGIKCVEKKEYYAASSVQKRLYIINQVAEKSTNYNIPSVVQLKGKVHKKRLDGVFLQLIERHESLRTSFEMVGGELVQIVHAPDQVQFEIGCLESGHPDISEFIQPFKLSRVPVLRVILFIAGENSSVLLVDIHHIISDEISREIIIQEFIAFYTGEKLSPLRYHYKDYSEWQISETQQVFIMKQGEYWKSQFREEVLGLEFPVDFPKSSLRDFSGDRIKFDILEPEKAFLKTMALETGTTMFMMILSVYYVFLAKLCNQEDIVIGTPVTGRSQCEMEKIIGMFVNTLALRNIPTGKKTFSEFLKEVKENTLNAFANQDYPYENLVEQVSDNVKGELGGNPLFDVMFVLHNLRTMNTNLPDLTLSSCEYESKTAKFDLTLNVLENEENLKCTFEYSTQLFKRDTIERFIGYFKTIISGILHRSTVPLGEIELISDKEKNEILTRFNNNVCQYPGNKLIQQIFIEKVESQPYKIAVVFENQIITYDCLNQLAEQMAANLLHLDVRQDAPVAVMLEPSLEMITAILAILKSGGGYLSIDPNYPVERFRFMLADSDTKVLITTSILADENEKLKGWDGECIYLDRINLQDILPVPLERSSICKEHLAYVIFTSGSTGNPKGVLVEHSNVIRLVKNTNYIDFKESDRILQTGALEFDASTFEIWGALLNGLVLFLSSKEKLLESQSLKNIIIVQGITILWLTAPLFNQLVVEKVDLFGKLRSLLVGGDKLSPFHINMVKKHHPNLSIINGYGPTENTTFSTTFLIEKEYKENIPIGKPITNSTAYILDKQDHLQPIGIVGELCVGGEGISRGYLNNPELTSSNFSYISFWDENTNLLISIYRTGDIARWLPCGNIEFIGRADQQIKIRGYRVEPGEIESHLLKHKKIKKAVVLSKESNNGNKELYAYVVTSTEGNINCLREFLSKEMPDYMVPSYFVFLEEIPLTPNGKVDRKKLLQSTIGFSPVRVQAPRNEMEEKLVELWTEVLAIPKDNVGIDSNFFELGGHSLKATSLISRLNKVFGVKVPLREIFRIPTVRKIAEFIKRKELKEELVSIKPTEKKEYYKLSSVQKRLYFIQQLDSNGTSYNIPLFANLTGNLDRERFEFAFKVLVSRHESFRTSFRAILDEPVQIIQDVVNFKIEYRNISEVTKSLKNTLNQEELIRSFDLTTAPLFRVKLFEIEHTKSILMLDMHHIISDGFSIGILLREFMALLEGKNIHFLKLQYRDYSHWKNSKQEKEKEAKQEIYWLNQLKDEPTRLTLPLDFSRPEMQLFNGNRLAFDLGIEETRKINSFVSERGITLFIFFLTIFNIFLSKICSQEDIVIGTPVASRHHPDIEQVIGMFVNTIVLRNYPSRQKSFKAFLKEVKEDTLKAFENIDYPFEEMVERVGVNRDISRNPLFDVMFIMQNLELPQIEIPGVYLQTFEDPAFQRISKFDLTLFAVERDEQLSFSFEYSTALFKDVTIKRFITYFKNIILGVIGNEKTALEEVEIIPEEEKNRILYDFNDTAVDYPEEKTIHCIYADQVERYPDYIALVGQTVGTDEGQGQVSPPIISYKELHLKSDRLCRILIEKGVAPGDIVGIMVERSFEELIGILAILKTGGAYLPIPQDYPQERVEYIMADSQIKILLSNREIEKSRLQHRCTYIDIASVILLNSIENIDYPVVPFPTFPVATPCYVLYTSGSTGKPKGVIVEHPSVINILTTMQREYPLLESEAYLLKTSYVFDVSVTELFGWFWHGGRLVILEQDAEKDPEKIISVIEIEGITHINFVPSMFNVFTSVLNYRNIGRLATLRYIFLAGEALLPELVNPFYRFGTKIKLENIYGPTEGTVYSSRYSLSQWNGNGSIPIGKPLSNIHLYILNSSNHIQPIGVSGELCISGTGLARGYLNRPVMTAEKFLSGTCNFNRRYRSGKIFISKRIYMTGDLARWLPDGNIEFLGRKDHQVKIRGFRVELDEIRDRILKHSGIKDAVVLSGDFAGTAANSADKYLCAYIVPESAGMKTTDQSPNESNFDAIEMREYLSRSLPDYMVPVYFIQLERIPVTISGKIDRNALPSPVLKSGNQYIAPGNRIEEKLVKIWSEVLWPGVSDSRYDSISIDDNFFQLGGHSLKAIILISRIGKVFNIHVKLADIFNMPSIRALSQYIERKERSQWVSIEPAEDKEYYPLTSPQKRLYVLQQMDKEGTSYNMPASMLLHGELDTQKLQKIFLRLIERHGSLRTSFDTIGEALVQRINKKVEFAVKYHTIDNCQEDSTSIIKSFIQPFDLAQAPLLRVGLISFVQSGNQPSQDLKIPGRYLLLVDMHHIVSDGISRNLLVKEFMRLYAGESLLKLRIQYNDYSQWQTSETQIRLLSEQEAYWLKEFQGEIPVLNLPLDNPRPKIQSFNGNSMGFEMGKGETKKLNQLALEAGTTIYMVLLAIFNIFLSKITNQEALIIGTPVAGRKHTDLESIIGMFVNTLVLKSFPLGEKTFNRFLKETGEKALEIFENQGYPFENLVERLSSVIPRDTGRNPLFDVMFVMQNFHMNQLEIPGLRLEPFGNENHTAKFDLMLSTVEERERLVFTFEYCTRLFKIETIRKFINYFKAVVSKILQKPEIPLQEIEIISETEKDEILFRFNDTICEYPEGKFIQQLFVQEVEAHPHKAAVVYEQQTISYLCLNRRADHLAAHLFEKGIRSGMSVGVMLEPSLEIVTAVLAILKANGSYLPIDPKYPVKRLHFMLSDSRANILITVDNLAKESGKLGAWEGSCIFLDRFDISGSSTIPLHLLPVPAASLAYIIYTSGSTGKPKGVMVEHQNVIRLVKNTEYIEFRERDRILQTGALEFDASTFEIWGALLNDIVLYLAPKEKLLSPLALKEIISSRYITILWLTSPLFNQMVQGDIELFAGLQNLLVGGDTLSPVHINRVKKRFPHLNIINGYGPTENTTFSTTFLIEKEYQENIPIGKPITNSTAYIVDKNGHLQPIGIIGELYVGGDGVSRGYLNNPELTSEKFLTISYQFKEYYKGYLTNSSKRIYKTGDLARWLPCGNIEFLGRGDQQVKIRGFRIEPGEIETHLLRHADINEAVVLAQEAETNDKYLCAYIVSTTSGKINQLREFLSGKLPDYMIPSYFIYLEEIPLTTNGKVDRKALPEPGEKEPDRGILAPRDEVEEKLTVLWAEVLGIAKGMMDIDSNFFQLGGHSLKAIALISRIYKTFEVKVPLVEIFRTPTIRELAAYIRKEALLDKFISLQPTEKREYYMPSSAQKRLYFIHQLDSDGTGYNIPLFVTLEGVLDSKRLEFDFKKLINRHESFRTSFKMIADEPVQRINSKVEFKIEYYESVGEENRESEFIKEFIRLYDLSNPPLLRVGLIKIEEKKHIMMCDMHHIIADGFSIGILVREFMAMHAGEVLHPLKLQYRDYSMWKNSPQEKGKVAKQEKYWLKEFEGEIIRLKLPLDNSRPETHTFKGDRVRFEISAEETKALNVVAIEEGVTLYILFLAIYNIFLSKICSQGDITVGTPVAARRHPDLEQVIGMFVNTLALRNYPQSEKTIKEFLIEVKLRAVEAFEHQDYPFDLLVEKVTEDRDFRRNPLFDVMFSFENLEIPQLQIRGLKLTPYSHENKTAKFDMNLVVQQGDELSISLEYNSTLFERETIERFSGYLRDIISWVLENREIKLEDISVTSDLLAAKPIELEKDFSF